MSHKCEHGKDSDVCVLCATESHAPSTETTKFVCPSCGGHTFGRDTATERGKVVVLDTVRCHGTGCGWRGVWPPKVGRPTTDGQPATGHIHLRVTMARKGWYVRTARLYNQTLAEWMQQECDKSSDYPPKGQNERV